MSTSAEFPDDASVCIRPVNRCKYPLRDFQCFVSGYSLLAIRSPTSSFSPECVMATDVLQMHSCAGNTSTAKRGKLQVVPALPYPSLKSIPCSPTASMISMRMVSVMSSFSLRVTDFTCAKGSSGIPILARATVACRGKSGVLVSDATEDGRREVPDATDDGRLSITAMDSARVTDCRRRLPPTSATCGPASRTCVITDSNKWSIKPSLPGRFPPYKAVSTDSAVDSLRSDNLPPSTCGSEAYAP